MRLRVESGFQNLIHILYPDDRLVDVETIIGWAQDSYFNHAPKCKEHGTVTVAEYLGKPVEEVLLGEFAASDPNNPCIDCYDYEPIYPEGTVEKPEDIFSAIEYLSDTGEVTFSKEPYVVPYKEPQKLENGEYIIPGEE